jgi:nitroreductase
MDLREAIYSRRATRDFTSEPVSEHALRNLIDAERGKCAALGFLRRPR